MTKEETKIMSHPVNTSLIKIVGVFAYNQKKDIQRFTQQGYEGMHLVELPQKFKEGGKEAIQSAIEKTKANYKNTYYSEFRDFMFTGKDQLEIDGFQKAQIRTLQRKKNLESNFHFQRFDIATKQMADYTMPLLSCTQEIYLFPGDIGMFALNLTAQESTLEHISDLINLSRSFESKIDLKGQTIQFQEWVSKEVLCGIPLVGDKLELDEYSGSKFKVYSVIEMQPSSETFNYNRDHLLYEIGTSSPLGVVANEHRLRPSEMFYEELMQQKISAFRNYEGLALLDSFTVIGHGNYAALNDESDVFIPHHTWNRVYFGIYIYNLFIRYSLFKFNAQFLSNPVKYRDEFQDFLNHYNFKHISFNFLPNQIFEKIRLSMRTEEEITTFEKRLGSLATTIQEQQEKRQAFLLTLISVISAFEAVDTIAAWLEKTQASIGLNKPSFYTLLGLLLLVAAYSLALYLFPLLSKKTNRKLKKWFKRNKE
jgi:hypothetical protein